MKPLLAGKSEFGAIYGTTAARVSEWVTRGVLDYSYARVISGSPYWLLDYARKFGELTARPKAVDEAALEAVVASQQPAAWMANVADLPVIVGQQEVMAIFGLEHGTLVEQAQQRGVWPAGDWHLSGSHLWLLSTALEAAELVTADPTARPWAPPGAERVRQKPLSRIWAADDKVVDALRADTYDGPGSRILPRGRAAKKSTSES
ncbi:hypothetical protein E6W39_29275 [Kitasatospora acidiphila]|uniref:Uncharacterized protein n=1 Tax=Kitasatospora acidiphila TaxID=2567942 RepID=A0A540W9I0_9ACTN|nr:hypothetical protein [Kitasatospora acidiphila]TQF05577.1 hypothetical protein E6W39_29275 [Kitasatospora acidiphila]